MDPKDYYKILGVQETASLEEIKKAYKKLSLKYHPDRQSNKSDEEKKEAEETFKKVNEAYTILSDSEKRSNYDKFGDPNSAGFNGFNPFGGWADPFMGSFFGGGFGGGGNRRVPQGEHIKMVVPLTFEEVFLGCTKKLKYERNVRCPNCHGAGGTSKKTCPDCNGTGYTTKRAYNGFGVTIETVACQRCKGTGEIVENKCPTCNGTGFKKETCIQEVTFVPGMIDKSYLTIREGGNESSSPNGPNGAFLAYVSYSFNSNEYKIQGLDVVKTVNLNYYDALLGYEYILQIPGKNDKKISIPSCMKDGELLRLIGQGITRDGYSGDFYLEIHYSYPDSLSDIEREALMKIRENSHSDK